MNQFRLSLIIATIILGIAGALGYNFIYLPNYQKVAQIQITIAEEQATQQAQKDISVLLQELETYRKSLPQSPDTSWLASEVMVISQQAGITLASIIQTSPEPYQQFVHLAIKLEFVCSYHELGTFVDLLERSDHFLRVERLEVSVAATGDSAGKPSVQIQIGSLYVPPVGSLAASQGG